MTVQNDRGSEQPPWNRGQELCFGRARAAANEADGAQEHQQDDAGTCRKPRAHWMCVMSTHFITASTKGDPYYPQCGASTQTTGAIASRMVPQSYGSNLASGLRSTARTSWADAPGINGVSDDDRPAELAGRPVALPVADALAARCRSHDLCWPWQALSC